MILWWTHDISYWDIKGQILMPSCDICVWLKMRQFWMMEFNCNLVKGWGVRNYGFAAMPELHTNSWTTCMKVCGLELLLKVGFQWHHGDPEWKQTLILAQIYLTFCLRKIKTTSKNIVFWIFWKFKWIFAYYLPFCPTASKFLHCQFLFPPIRILEYTFLPFICLTKRKKDCFRSN